MKKQQKTTTVRKVGKRGRSKTITKTRRYKGRGVVKDWLKKAGKKIWANRKKIMSFIKKNKLISKGLSRIPYPLAQQAAAAASQAGLGRRRKIRMRKGYGTTGRGFRLAGETAGRGFRV